MAVAPGLLDIVAALMLPGQPEVSFAAVDRAIETGFGRAWTTVLKLEDDGLRRIYTSIPGTFPLGGVKRLDNAVWARGVLTDHTPFYADGVEAVTAAYADHAIPLGLGVVRIANIPIVFDGVLRGVLCPNGRAEHRWGVISSPSSGSLPLCWDRFSPLLT
jgi:hypothetical protein